MSGDDTSEFAEFVRQKKEAQERAVKYNGALQVVISVFAVVAILGTVLTYANGIANAPQEIRELKATSLNQHEALFKLETKFEFTQRTLDKLDAGQEKILNELRKHP